MKKEFQTLQDPPEDLTNIKGVKIYSNILQSDLWLVFDRAFKPDDGIPVYSAEEWRKIKKKTVRELREIHRVKTVFPGSRVVQ